MWEGLTTIFLVLTVILLVIAIFNFILAYSLNKFLKDNIGNIKDIANSDSFDQMADLIIDQLANYNAITKILFKIGFVRKIVKAMAKSKAVDGLIKALKTCRNLAFSIGLSALLSMTGMFGLANVYYTMDITNKTASAIIRVLFNGELINEEEEEDGWEWDKEPEKPSANTTPGSTPSGGGGTNSPGNATGQYAIELDDGTYYWYHQSSDKCTYDAVVDGIRTSTLVPHHSTMVGRGCSVYSTAMVVSNLLGKEVTPIHIIRDMLKVDIKNENGTYKFTNGPGRGIHFASDAVYTNKSQWAASLNEVYGSEGIRAKAINVHDQAAVDEVLAKGGYIITSFKKMDFTWYRRTKSGSHYIVIRKKDANGNYYCLNSTGGSGRPGHDGAVNSMTTPATFAELDAAYTMDDGVAVWGEGIQYTPVNTPDDGGGGQPSIEVGIDTDVEAKLLASSTFKGKAKTLAMVYAAAKPVFGHNFALGLMANVQHEGNFGMVEGIWWVDNKSSAKNGQFTCGCNLHGKWAENYWTEINCELHNILDGYGVKESKKYMNQWFYDQLMTIPKSTAGVGVGICQWSGSRRWIVLDMYTQMASDWSIENIQAVEIAAMLYEFQNGYKGVPASCAGKSVEDCSKAITLDYLKPRNKSQRAIERAKTATELADILGRE